MDAAQPLTAADVLASYSVDGLTRVFRDYGQERWARRIAQAIAEQALEDVLGLIRPGMTEKQVMAELVYRTLRYGSEGNSFDPIVVAGTHSSMPHGVPTDNKIEKNSFFIVRLFFNYV